MTVGERLIDKAGLGDGGFIVVCVVEGRTLRISVLSMVDAVPIENLHRGIDPVAVVRIVLEQVHLVHESAAEGLPEIDVGLVRVERAVWSRTHPQTIRGEILPVTMFITPPSASVPNPTGTTPL